MTRVLITGGAGYVGSVSAEAFLDAGHEVVVLDDLTTGHRAAVPAGATLHVGTYADGEALAALLRTERIDAILHCAARSLVGESIAIRRATSATTWPVASPCSRPPGPAASSGSCSRRRPPSTACRTSTPIPEDAPLRPINPYGETKRAFEGALGWYGRAYGLRSVTLRYFNVAGATDDARRGPRSRDPPDPERPPGRRSTGTEVTVFGDDYPTPDGTCIRDYIHVADLADAHRSPSRRRRRAIRGPTSRWSATSATAAGSPSAR